jgi:hypothetical protein
MNRHVIVLLSAVAVWSWFLEPWLSGATAVGEEPKLLFQIEQKNFGPSPESVDDFMMYTRAEGVEPDFCNWS